MSAWFLAFVWTLAVEGLVLELLLGHFARRVLEPIGWCLALNLATHPLFSWWVLARVPSAEEIALAEVAIALTEGALLAVVLRTRAGLALPILAAVVANGASYAFGLWVLAPLCAS